MASRAAAGSTVAFGAAALGEVVSVVATENGDVIDVTRLAASRAENDVGQSDLGCEIEFTGWAAGTIGVGDLGNVVITPNDGSGAVTLTNMIVTALVRNSPKRGELTSTISLKAAYTA